jgi:DNA polymerase-3 subunit epsilon
MMITKAIELELPFWCQRALGAAHDYVILDTETTGKYGEVVEIAILDLHGNVLLNSLLRPTEALTAESIRLNRITPAMLGKAPTLIDLWPEVQHCLQGRKIITYNAWFDSKRIAHSAGLYGLPNPDWLFYCLMVSYAEFWRAPLRRMSYPWQRLSVACGQQNVDLSMVTTHRSLGEAQTILALMRRLAEQGELAPTYQTTYVSARSSWHGGSFTHDYR